MSDLISIFTSSHNGERFLEEAIKSVLEQSYEHFEYLLYDDGSTDSTLDIMQYWASIDTRIRVESLSKQANVGPIINKSFWDADGAFWVWVPDDDCIMGTLLEDKLSLAQEWPDAVIYNNWYIIDENGKLIKTVDVKTMTPDMFNKEVWETSPIGFTGIWIPTIIGRRLPFPTHLKFSEDFYWMIEATLNGVDFINIDKRLHYKRVHPNRTTSRNINKILDQVPKIRETLKEKYNVNT